MSLASGTRLGPYEIRGSIGAGGMGEVYRAHDPRLGRDVALKILPNRDEESLERFTREARAIAALNHPHIVTIFSTEEAEGVRFITMELIEGRTLDRLIPEAGASMPHFFDVAIAVADALAAAHEKKITHRDLKPANVMVTDSGRVKILDFGLARGGEGESSGPANLEDELTRQKLTQAGTILGTMPYMSPEQIEAKPLDGRSDLFALGIVMYEMATGARPFRGSTPPSLMSSILKDHPRPCIEVRPDMPEGVSRMVARCLEKDRRDRFQTAQELLVELRAERRWWETGASASRVRVGAAVTPPGPAAELRIAVLPFTDLSSAKDQDWFCDGVAEEILTALSQIRGLTVAARASAFSFRGRGDDLKAIGEKLRVTTVLDGSVRRAGERLRVTVRLSDVASEQQIWSERYDREVKDVFDVQDEIARAVADRLRVGLSGEAPKVVRHTVNQEAYHLFLRGRHLWYSRSKGSLLRARQLFEEATTLDPGYALPYVGLADLFLIQSLYGFEREDVATPRAKNAIERALALNPGLADAHRALGLSRLFFNFDMRGADSALQKAVELDPGSGLSQIWLGWPVWKGRGPKAIAAARRAQEVDPLNVYVQSLVGGVLDLYGRSEEALPELARAFEIDRNYVVAHYMAGGINSRLGRHDEALFHLGKGVELSDRAPFYVSYEAWGFARAGRTKEARAGLEELKARATTEHVQPLFRAVPLSALGEMDEAFRVLDEAAAARNGWLASPRMPMFENFRGDARFRELLRRIGHADAED